MNGIATITIPSIDWNGSETITFTANDGEYEASDEATFTVNPVNDAPEVSDIPGQTIDEGQTFTSIDLNEYVTDIDEDDITWTASGNIELAVEIVNGIATITIPSINWNGSETITFTASDGEYTEAPMKRPSPSTP